MKSLFALLLVAVLAPLTNGATLAQTSAHPSPSPSATPQATFSKWQLQQREIFRNSAPADEYFGRMKMSYLGMNNTFRDASISSGDHTTDTKIAGRIALAEDALEDWARKFPLDPQLARTYYLATVVERKIWLQPNQDRAWIYLNRLVKTFPDSYFGRHLKADLAIGFTEHYYAAALPCAPPPDDPDATPVPVPSPTPVTLEPGRRLLVLPSACIPLPSPSPTPSLTLTLTLTLTHAVSLPTARTVAVALTGEPRGERGPLTHEAGMAAKRKVAPPKPSLDRPWAELSIAQQNLIYTNALHAYTTGKGPNPATRPEFFRAKAAAKA